MSCYSYVHVAYIQLALSMIHLNVRITTKNSSIITCYPNSQLNLFPQTNLLLPPNQFQPPLKSAKMYVLFHTCYVF